MRFFIPAIMCVELTLFVGLVGGYYVSSRNENSAMRQNLSPIVESSSVVVAQAADKKTDFGEDGVVTSEIKPGDARYEVTKRYLEKYKSPLLPYSDLIVQLADTYGFDFKYILAIGQKESNLCKKIPENSYNCWGYGIHKKGTLRFDSYELALKSYAEYLKKAYFDKGLTTPELMAGKYNPVTPEQWAWGVRFFMEKIDKGDF